jgi:CDGSH-type Zn-finger protein/uncharacterized Fe-S cluster protein YjdI
MKAATHRDQLIGMLTEAAEIEHCLMCTYLYGAFSLKQHADEGLKPEELTAVRRWRGEVIRIATDEMLHLALVSNLLMALGARPHYRRFNFPIAPGLFPADIAVALAPLDEAMLDHFVYLERPRDAAENDAAIFEKAQYARATLSNRLMAFADDYSTVGELYEAIEASFETMSAEIGEPAVFVGDLELQMSSSVFQLPGLCRIGNLADAKRAIHLIIKQGEGSREAVENSHYARFVAIRNEWRALHAKRPDFVPYRNAARNPVMRSPISGDRLQILAEPASTLLDAGNACYGLMLRLLSLVADDPAYFAQLPAGRKTIVDQTLLLMHITTEIGSALTTLPAHPDHPGVRAGLTFTVSRQALSFPSVGASAALLAEKFTAVAARIVELAKLLPSLTPYTHALFDCASAWGGPVTHAPLAAAAVPVPSATSAPPASSVASTATVGAVSAPPPVAEVAVGRDVTIRFDTARCIHSRHCVLGEPAVFLANTPGEWIFPDQATPERIAIVAHNCPSGAVTYSRHDGGPNEVPPKVNVVRVRENGPLAFHAELALEGAAPESCNTRATLCRCGQSKLKPYCDGSHNAAGFVASGEPLTQASEALQVRGGSLRISPQKDGPLLVEGNLELLSGTGRTINRLAEGSALRLCRCGGSANKPYCDGTHRVNGFAAEGAV